MPTSASTPNAVLTYPISADYVKAGRGGAGWTVERALAEFIANALDEDRNAKVAWADGVLTITDEGPGMPEEGLLLGYSPKDDAQIGQFGEGSKIGALVLARDSSVGAFRIETVGYGFVPTIESRSLLDGIAPRRCERAPEVLVYSFFGSDRARGTKVTIQVGQRVADAAIARFRHLNEAGYTTPSVAQVLLGEPAGRLFIGGGFVSQTPRLLARYDFPLARAKSAQNRDRTVIAAETVNTLVRAALAGCANAEVIGCFVGHVLAGGALAEAERYFGDVTDPRVKAAFRAEGRARFAGQSAFYCAGGQEEAVLTLLDASCTLVTTKLDPASHTQLMALLGVTHTGAAMAKVTRAQAQGTTYLPETKLTAGERAVLNGAREAAGAVFGADAVGTVRVYTNTGRYLSCTLGFYDPASGHVALTREVLEHPGTALEVLLHEMAHRICHQRGVEYADRSRGFENQLGAMLAAAVGALAGTASAPTAVVAGEPAAPPAGLAAAAVIVPRARELMAELMTARLPGACARHGLGKPSGSALMTAVGLHTGLWSLLSKPKPARWRRSPGSTSPSVMIDYRVHEVLGGALDVPGPVLWLAHMFCEAERYDKRASAPAAGPWTRKAAANAALAADGLDAHAATHPSAGPAYTRAAAALRTQAATGVRGDGLDAAFAENILTDLLAG